EHALERLAVAITLDAPARQDQVLAGRLEVQVDAVAVGPEPRLGHRLVASALQVFGEAQDQRAPLDQLLVAWPRQRRHLAELRRSLAVIAADLRDQRAL